VSSEGWPDSHPDMGTATQPLFEEPFAWDAWDEVGITRPQHDRALRQESDHDGMAEVGEHLGRFCCSSHFLQSNRPAFRRRT
jgi:hypothetical protein